MKKPGFIKKLIQLIDPFNLFKDNFYVASNFVIGQKGPVWIDTAKPYHLYNTIPQLKAVINRKATMFSNMELYVIDIKSKTRLEDKDLDKLLQNPNPLQAQNDWL